MKHLNMKDVIKDDFDWKFYTSFYSDFSHLNTHKKAYSHWLTHGKTENRLINEKLLDEQNKKIIIVTSFNERGLKEYARDFLITYNLPFDLVVYSEDKLDLREYKVKNLKFENLYEDKQFENFIKSDPPTEFTSRRNYDRCNDDCPFYCFEHQFNISGEISPLKKCIISEVSWNKFKIKVPKCGKTRVSALEGRCVDCLGTEKHVKECKKFSFKVFAQKNAFLKYKNDYDYLLWIDADCVFNNVPNRNFYNLIKSNIKNNMLGFMRRPTYSECGFMIFNLKHKYLSEYYKDVSNIWLSNEIYYTQQNHDSFIMDLIRERLEKKYKTILHVDIASYGKDKGIVMQNMQILELTQFIYYFYHHKGPRKFLTLDEKKLVNNNFT